MDATTICLVLAILSSLYSVAVDRFVKKNKLGWNISALGASFLSVGIVIGNAIHLLFK
jgi:hypothetical protein